MMKKNYTAAVISRALRSEMSRSLLNEDKERVGKLLHVMRDWFGPQSPRAIAKELLAIEALQRVNVRSEPVAARALGSIRDSVKSISFDHLQCERAELVEALQKAGHDLDTVKLDETTETCAELVNEWVNPRSVAPVHRIAQLEDRVLQHMLQPQEDVVQEVAERVDPLVMRLAMKKFNKKYAEHLTEGQRGILQSYIHGDDVGSLSERLNELRGEALERIDAYIATLRPEQVLLQKNLTEVRGRIEGLHVNADRLDEKTIGRYMSVAGLVEELCSPDDEGKKK